MKKLRGKLMSKSTVLGKCPKCGQAGVVYYQCVKCGQNSCNYKCGSTCPDCRGRKEILKK